MFDFLNCACSFVCFALPANGGPCRGQRLIILSCAIYTHAHAQASL